MSHDLPIAEVAFNLATGRGFDYEIPPELRGRVAPGSRVTALFRGHPKSGYVIRLKVASEFPGLEKIQALEDPARQIPEPLLKLGDWISSYYCASHESVIWNLLPAVVRRGEMQHREALYLDLAAKAQDQGTEEFLKLTPKRQAVLKTFLKLGGSLPAREAMGAVDASSSVIDALVADGWLLKVKRVQERDPFANLQVVPDLPKALTRGQQKALDAVVAEIDSKTPRPVLLFGVTGSGKTEVFLQAIAHCCEQGRDAIVLVPEISLTPQTVTRFRARFGDQVSVLHSGLSDGQRFDEWTKINSGRAHIAIGARSALFAPFRNLGLIVVDEEHESTYKQDTNPHYNARDVAVVRGALERCAVLLGSATPSLESYHNCLVGKYRLVEMPERIDDHPLPPIELVDMHQDSAHLKDERKAGFFSRRLEELIHDRLAKHEQIIIFLNRRGFSTQLTCPQCGYTASCDNCSVTYTYHRKAEKLMCHLCQAQLDAPKKCPQCGSDEIRYGGYGTERVEAVARACFPEAMVARMDSDTMSNAESYRKVLDAFRARKIDILIGTQMIAKGLDFPNVTLVGIIQADIGLNVPDFRSAERTFDLITQVAGRAGRGEVPGRVVVQTCTPGNYALTCAQRQDFKDFYAQETPARETLGFPPFTHLVLLHFKSPEEAKAAAAAAHFMEVLQPLLRPEVQVIGPMPAPIAKIAKFYRYQILLRAADVRGMVAAIRAAKAQVSPAEQRRVPIDIDVDPRYLQ
ncbi:MAG: primosomal protein N' [Victivallales bacterium]|nr:primosomal protein N' [Victivallales bacterium]